MASHFCSNKTKSLKPLIARVLYLQLVDESEKGPLSSMHVLVPNNVPL